MRPPLTRYSSVETQKKSLVSRAAASTRRQTSANEQPLLDELAGTNRREAAADTDVLGVDVAGLESLRGGAEAADHLERAAQSARYEDGDHLVVAVGLDALEDVRDLRGVRQRGGRDLLGEPREHFLGLDVDAVAVLGVLVDDRERRDVHVVLGRGTPWGRRCRSRPGSLSSRQPCRPLFVAGFLEASRPGGASQSCAVGTPKPPGESECLGAEPHVRATSWAPACSRCGVGHRTMPADPTPHAPRPDSSKPPTTCLGGRRTRTARPGVPCPPEAGPVRWTRGPRPAATSALQRAVGVEELDPSQVVALPRGPRELALEERVGVCGAHRTRPCAVDGQRTEVATARGDAVPPSQVEEERGRV